MIGRGPKCNWVVPCPHPWSKYQSYWLCNAFPLSTHPGELCCFVTALVTCFSVFDLERYVWYYSPHWETAKKRREIWNFIDVDEKWEKIYEILAHQFNRTQAQIFGRKSINRQCVTGSSLICIYTVDYHSTNCFVFYALLNLKKKGFGLVMSCGVRIVRVKLVIPVELAVWQKSACCSVNTQRNC